MLKENKKKEYHDIYFKKIMKMYQDLRLELAIHEFQQYLKNYPNDLAALIHYADALIMSSRLEEAEEILFNISIPEKNSIISLEFLLLIKCKLFCSQGKYKEAFLLLQENIENFEKKEMDITMSLLFLKKKLNLLADIEKKSSNSYLFQQIIDYQEQLALFHIKKHNSYEGSLEDCQFVSNFPIDDIYYQLRGMLPIYDIKINHDIIANMYVFKFDNNGRFQGKLVDYFKVVSLRDSNDIITMCPYDNSARLPYYDLTPSIKEDEIVNVKRMSRIEKFNQRYQK